MDDVAAICDQLRAAIRREGWSKTARRSGINRVQLHRMFGPRGNPKIEALSAVARNLGFAIRLDPRP